MAATPALVPDALRQGDLAAFESSARSDIARKFPFRLKVKTAPLR